jgi:hypothetical protein
MLITTAETAMKILDLKRFPVTLYIFASYLEIIILRVAKIPPHNKKKRIELTGVAGRLDIEV